MLELIGVSKRYGDAVALHPTTLSFQASKTYVLLGTSGCGKSTLLRIALGLIAPTTGSVKFDDRMVEAKNLQQFRHRVGYVVQQGGLFPHLTALENVSLCATYLGWSETRIRSRVEELAALSQLPSEVLDRYPDELSGGQQQRVGLMRALMLDPEVLLLDEPLGALDPLIRSELQADLREIFRSLSKTVVLVTHDLHEAAYFADQVVLLRDGRVVQQGSIKDLVNAPSEPFVERFIRAQRHTLSLSTFGEDCE